MSKKKTEVVETFKARNDAGRTFEVTVFQEFIWTQPMRDPGKWIPGLKELRLDDDRPLNKIDDDTFETFDTRERLSRV